MHVRMILVAARSVLGSVEPSFAKRLRSLTCVAGLLVLFPAATRAQGDVWIGPWDWACQIEPGPAIGGSEISHAALIPHGPYRGMVLMWRAPRNVPPDPPQTET